ncbi:MAG: primosomal protein N' [Pseudomonadales bacterium]|nr:primosomal protein N' [Pseudomonadales bacterium]
MDNSSKTTSPKIVQVAVPRPVHQTFDYRIPDRYDMPKLGTRVKVSFGQSSLIGVVIGTQGDSARKLKSIEEVLDIEPVLDEELMRLAAWMSRYYHHPIGEVHATMLPIGARAGKPLESKDLVLWQAVVSADHKIKLARAPKQQKLYLALAKHGPLTGKEAQEFDGNTTLLKALERKGLAQTKVHSPNYQLTSEKLELSEEQETAVQGIIGSLNSFTVHLLEGITGSGKTEVYLRAMAETLARGLQALILVPEIGLAPQTVKRVRERFGEAAMIHSATSPAHRFNTWNNTKTGKHRILIGTRSALFTPFQKLGLIIVDEEHDTSFKQTEGLRYSARDVAIVRGQILGIPVVLGSATPSFESILNAERRRFKKLHLSHRPGTAALPTYKVQDIRGLRLEGGLSQPLINAIDNHLKNNSQVLIFVNRRGYSRTLYCTHCGWQASCSDCDANLTLHQQPEKLQCHQCSRTYEIPSTCAACGKSQLLRLGVGTQRLEDTLKRLFPNVPVFRVDRDAVRTPAKLESVFDNLSRATPGILLGTQMLAKGHHLPNVTLVGIVDADNGFLSTDFRAAEQTAQLIVQVAGRAGRAERRGEVWVQTYNPTNPNLKALIHSGYRGFYSTEIQKRRAAGFPPFGTMAIIRAESLDENAPLKFVRHILNGVKEKGVEAIGPVPAPLKRRQKHFRYQGLLLSDHRSTLHKALQLIRNQKVPAGIRWSIDVDPIDTR